MEKKEKILYIAMIVLAALILLYCVISTIIENGTGQQAIDGVESFIQGYTNPICDVCGTISQAGEEVEGFINRHTSDTKSINTVPMITLK